MKGASPRRVLLVASAGGHIAQLLQLKDCFAGDDRTWVTFDHASIDVGDDPILFCHYPTTRNLPNLVRNTRLALRHLTQNPVDLVVSTGAAVAIPFFIAGRLIGAKTLFLEVFDRIETKTLTGRIAHRMVDAFLVQWHEQRRIYGSATVIGPVYQLATVEGPVSGRAGDTPRIFVTVGTDYHQFDRLVGWVDGLMLRFEAQGFVQRGMSEVATETASERYLDPERLDKELEAADVVISHGGPSTIVEAISHGHQPIVVPRDPSHHEHVDAHQLRFARHLAQSGTVLAAYRFTELVEAVAQALTGGRGPKVPVDPPPATVSAFEEQLARLLERPRKRLEFFRRRAAARPASA